MNRTTKKDDIVKIRKFLGKDATEKHIKNLNIIEIRESNKPKPQTSC